MDSSVGDNKKPTNYQYTRGVRFKAEPVDNTKLLFEKEETKNVNLTALEEDLSKFHKDLTDLLYNKEKKIKNKSDKKFKTTITINKLWLKCWHKDIFYGQIKKNSNKKGKYNLKDLNSLPFKEKLEQWDKACKEIKKFSSAPQDSQYRRSDFAEWIKLLLNNWKYFNDFLRELHAKSPEDDKKITQLKEDSDKIHKNLKISEKSYLSFQSSGVEIAKASLNYYTVNKKPKEYDKELKEAEKDLKEDSFSSIVEEKYRYQLKSKSAIFTFKSKQEKEWIERYCKEEFNKNLKENDIGLSLDKTYSMMKAFKAEQKSIFYELASRVPLKANDNLRNKSSTSLFTRFQEKVSHTNSDKKEDYINNNKKHFLFNYKFLCESFSSIDKLSESFSLFKDIKGNKKFHYEEFVKLCKKIKNPKNKKEGSSNTKKLAEKRGKYLKKTQAYFKEYTDFCDDYEKIAQKRGKLIAQIKGIEKEKRESSEINYWALIYTKSGKRQLWLIPKKPSQTDKSEQNNSSDTNLQSAKKCIDKKPQASAEANSYLSSFESLTMRALHKLCFAEQSSFVKEMPDELKKQQKEVKTFRTQGDKEKLKQKEKKEINFLKDLLKDNYTKSKLKLNNFNLTKVHKAENKQDFELALEKDCYYEKKVSFNDKEKEEFIKKFHVSTFKISSYDLQGRNKNTHQSPESENRIHTDWWNEFWKKIKNNQEESIVKEFKIGAIRLNPEIKIRHRKVDKNLEAYFYKRKFPKEFKHRNLQEQFTAHFTLSLNAGKKYEDLAFSKPEEILEKIENFNQRLNKSRNFETAWKYGIDRGNIELATLCLSRFNREDFYEVKGIKILKPTFTKTEKDTPCYSLKNYDLKETYQTKTQGEKTRFAVQNVSYFLEEKYLNDTNFKPENLTCLDLTTAKVIKGKIITNGDIMTYLKLKKAVAKRSLFELYTKREINDFSKLQWIDYEHGDKNRKMSDGVLNIKTKDGEKTIYWYCRKYENILINSNKNIKYSKKSILCSLSSYLGNLKESNNQHTPSILKINHLRDALTANMVGVICFLQKKYPGFIILEDLNRGIIDRHFFQHNENISRRLENALYNKFQTLGLVPPHVKDIIQLRENNRKKANKEKEKIEEQIGAIVFVSEENTSKTCPYCEEISKKQNKELKNDLKFRQHRFICDSCGFDTYYFYENPVKEPTPEIDETKKKKEFEIVRDIDDPDKVASFNVAKKSMKESS